MRSALLAGTALTLCVLACSGGSDRNGVPDAGASLQRHTYVASEIHLPTSNAQAQAYGLDLDGDGRTDNQLGQILSVLASQGIDLQTALQTAIARGTIIQLLELQTAGYVSSSSASLNFLLGDSATATPPPCSGPSDTVCGRHLQGTGSFTIAGTAPVNSPLSGTVASGTFDGGPGQLTLPLVLGASPAVSLTLLGARARATGMADTGIDSVIVGGGISQSDVDNLLVPALQSQFEAIVARDCTDPGSPPTCGCASGSAGATLRTLFDTNPVDCAVSVAEIRANSLMSTLLAPDMTINGTPSLSLGVGFKAVKATFPSRP
jgi:hypothetical protein